jgi:hypothetical protein
LNKLQVDHEDHHHDDCQCRGGPAARRLPLSECAVMLGPGQSRGSGSASMSLSHGGGRVSGCSRCTNFKRFEDTLNIMMVHRSDNLIISGRFRISAADSESEAAPAAAALAAAPGGRGRGPGRGATAGSRGPAYEPGTVPVTVTRSQ